MRVEVRPGVTVTYIEGVAPYEERVCAHRGYIGPVAHRCPRVPAYELELKIEGKVGFMLLCEYHNGSLGGTGVEIIASRKLKKNTARFEYEEVIA